MTLPWKVTATGATTSRSIQDRLGDVVNVKDFGATGDGTTDDRAAIQAAIDYSFGAPGSEHKDNTQYLNHSIFFPSGTYKITAPIWLTYVFGPRLFGAGKMATQIFNSATSGSAGYGSVIRTNGVKDGVIENMHLKSGTAKGSGSTTNACFDYDWDGLPGTLSSNGLLFRNVRFENGDYGCSLGAGSFGTGRNPQCSEVMWIGCDFINHYKAIVPFNGNALDFAVVGGKFESCDYGTYSQSHCTITYVSGVRSSGSTNQDHNTTSPWPPVYEACVSTSQHFLHLQSNAAKTISCWHNPSASGGYTDCVQCPLIIDGCLESDSATVLQDNVFNFGSAYMRGSRLPANFITGSGGQPTYPSVVENI